MNEYLQYPYNAGKILRKRAKIREELLAARGEFIDTKIAVLGGSTTHDVVELLELFLLQYGIRPRFYETEYGQYWQTAVFDEDGALKAFAPNFVYIHTGVRNILAPPALCDSEAEAAQKLEAEYKRYEAMWRGIREKCGAVILQNNFEMPGHRLLGNLDSVDPRGLTAFVEALNGRFAAFARENEQFHINDIHYLSALEGLDNWDPGQHWYLYKYALSRGCMPALAASVARLVKAALGKNKKLLALDLDNTLWGGIVGDDGPEGLEIGHETPMGEAYYAFQAYIKAHKDLGVLLTVNSKNEQANALAGLAHPEGALHKDDFVAIKANWQPKGQNLVETAKELALFPDSFVFVDDNPAEREQVRQSGLGVAIPEMGEVTEYIRALDREGYFEPLSLSSEDAARVEMYNQNSQRLAALKSFADYGAYLESLTMSAEIGPFQPVYLPRIAQLCNKSNQFNLTTRRYTQPQLEAMAADDSCITLYGKLTDSFGDNGVVSVVAGHVEGETLHMDLWLMSCRVLKRGMENAMMDALVARAVEKGVKTVHGYYFKTEKNAMVADFYGQFGFVRTSLGENGDSEWLLDVAAYKPGNQYIKVENI